VVRGIRPQTVSTPLVYLDEGLAGLFRLCTIQVKVHRSVLDPFDRSRAQSGLELLLVREVRLTELIRELGFDLIEVGVARSPAGKETTQ